VAATEVTAARGATAAGAAAVAAVAAENEWVEAERGT